MIILHEFKKLFRNNFIPLLILIFMSIILLCTYNIIYINKDSIENALSKMSTNFLSIFNIDKLTFCATGGYYAFYIKCLSFLSSFFVLSLGLDIAKLDKEENTKDFLYAKPINRKRIILYRIIGSLLYILSFVVVIFIISIIFFKIKNYNYNFLKLIQIDFSLFLLESIFFSYGLVVGGFYMRHKIITSVVCIIPFIIINIIDSFVSFDLLYYINPFSYFEFNKIISDGYQYSSLIITIFLFVFLINFGINIYSYNLNEKSDD